MTHMKMCMLIYTSIYSFTVGTGAWISLTHRLV